MRSPERNGAAPSSALAVEQSAVLAAQILDAPVVAGAHQRHVLARKPGVVGIAQFAGAGAAQRDAVAVQRHRDGFALQIANDQFFHGVLEGRGHDQLTISVGQAVDFRRLPSDSENPRRVGGGYVCDSRDLSKGLSTRFHHISAPVRNKNAGERPRITHSALVRQPAKLPNCR